MRTLTPYRSERVKRNKEIIKACDHLTGLGYTKQESYFILSRQYKMSESNVGHIVCFRHLYNV